MCLAFGKHLSMHLAQDRVGVVEAQGVSSTMKKQASNGRTDIDPSYS